MITAVYEYFFVVKLLGTCKNPNAFDESLYLFSRPICWFLFVLRVSQSCIVAAYYVYPEFRGRAIGVQLFGVVANDEEK